MTAPKNLAVLPVRNGLLSPGAGAVVAEAGGRCLLAGSRCAEAAAELAGVAEGVAVVELGLFDGPGWAAVLTAVVDPDRHLLLPSTADGRDLAPHLAARLGHPLVTGATALSGSEAVVARHDGATMERLRLEGPVVATFQAGVRAEPVVAEDAPPPAIEHLAPPAAGQLPPGPGSVRSIEELEADPATMDLAEAPRIVAAGAGLGDRAQLGPLEAVAEQLGASVGATRVVTDWGWLPADRQIGTTGIGVDPDLYIAVGISGAVQHTAGLGEPEHVVVVNTDPSCPMMGLADLAIVCDGPRFLAELQTLLASRNSSSA